MRSLAWPFPLLFPWLISSTCLAEAPVAERQMAEITVVAGTQPGPGLWRVSKDDHVMWVLATVSPLPKRMVWDASEVQAVIAESSEVIAAPTTEVTFDRSTLGMMFLLPSALGARKNPEDRTLAEIVPPADYQRWTRLKRQYLGRGRKVEKFRPIFASGKLFEEALDDLDLSFKSVVWPLVEKSAKRRKLVITTPEVELKITDPKAKLKSFKSATLNDLDCFHQTLNLVENDLGTLKQRANAWATGDIQALRSLPLAALAKSCSNAFLSSEIAEQSGIGDVEQRLADAWLKSARKALHHNRSTLAVLGIPAVLDSNNYLAALAREGFLVEAPGEANVGPDSTVPGSL